MYTNFPRALRFLRLRKGWSQETLGAKAGVSRETVSRAERGDINGMTVASIDRIARVVAASVNLQLRWQGEQLDRLMDAAHASIQQQITELLMGLGWLVRVEVSFNHYGERGRVDIVAFHPTLRILLIIEIKSALGDLQETLGRLDVKVRLGQHIARELGWTDVAVVVPALVIGDSRVARRTLAEHVALFSSYPLRGRAALAWLRRPTLAAEQRGLLWFVKRPNSHHTTIPRGQRAPKHPNSHLA